MALDTYLDEFEQRDWESTTDGTVRFAVIGLGWWTIDMALPALEAVDTCEATVAVSGSHSKAQSVVTDHDTLTHGITYEEFYDNAASEAYDAVYVCSPNALHLPYAEKAAELGKAVLCEKPMEATVERAERMVTACENGGVPLMIGYRMQTEPAIRRARELVRSGAIGLPVQAIGNNSQRLLDINNDHDQWRLDPALAGRGASVTDIGIYPLNTSRFVLEADPVAVHASMDSRHDAFEAVPDERSAFTCTLDDGTLLACTASQHAQSSTSLRIIGTEGEIYIEPAFHMETELRLKRGEATADLSTPQVDQMEEMFAYFGQSVLADGPIGPDGEHGLVDMRAIEAIYDAAETGQRINI